MENKKVLDVTGFIIIMSTLTLLLMGEGTDSKSPPNKNTAAITESEKENTGMKAGKFADAFLGIQLAYEQDNWDGLVKYFDNENIFIRRQALHWLDLKIDSWNSRDQKKYPTKGIPGELSREYCKIFFSREVSFTSEAEIKIITDITEWVRKNAPPKKSDVKLSKLETLITLSNVLTHELYDGMSDDMAIELFKLFPHLYRLCDKYPENETNWYKEYKEISPDTKVSEKEHVGLYFILSILGGLDIDKNKEIGFKDISDEEESNGVIKKCEKVISWFDDNIRYCYYHPEEHRFKLDEDARSNNTSSKEYRVKQPWGKDEGPNKTDPKKKPVK